MIDIYVIIPVYNAAEFLRTTVESVVSQPYKHIKIVLIDDGSCDGSDVICKQLSGEYPNITAIHQENKGVSAARNVGIEYVLKTANNTDYIAFLDADDFWHPNFLQQACDRIADQQHDIFAFGMMLCDKEASKFSSPSLHAPHIISGGTNAIWSINTSFASNIYKASLLKKWNIRFFEDFKYSEDKYFRMQCCFFAESISFENAVQYIYRDNSAGAMKKSKKMSAIDYYLPIVDGWLKSDDFINRYSPLTGKTITAGNILACIYLLDMAKTHFMNWGARKDLFEVLNKHPHYSNLKTLRKLDSRDSNFKNKELLIKHPYIFEWKYKFKGILYHTLRFTLHIPVIHKIRNIKKYPHSKVI